MLTPDVINLVVAAREFWDANNDLSDESRALDKALEPFSSLVPYENEPDDAALAAVVGETERDAMRRRIYADLAKEGGGTWATYVCMDIDALEDAAFEAGKDAAPSAPEGWQPISAGVFEAMAEALRPFATTDWADENGWTDIACQNDRVVDWFGPSQFFAAGTAYLAYCNLPASCISQQDAELDRMRREVEEAKEFRAILEGHLGAAIDDYNEALGALKWMAERDDRNGSLPEAYRKKIDETLAALCSEAEETRT